MGNGYLESVYQECLEIEFLNRGIPFFSQKLLELSYKGKKLNQMYKPDFVCFEKIIVELKGVKAIANEHHSQVLNYLKATELKLGLIINFGSYPKVEIKRIVL